MQPVALRPNLHLFVCQNRRADGDPLGPGCGARGDAVYDALKDEVAKHRLYHQVWVTKTQCLGVCPKVGCTVALYGPAAGGTPILRDVDEPDARALFRRKLGGGALE